MKQAIRFLLLVCGLVFSAAPYAQAKEGVFVEALQPAITGSFAIDVVKQALARGKWKVVSSDADSVVAERYKDSIDAEIEISIVERAIKYREVSSAQYILTGSFGPANTGTEHRVRKDAAFPEAWVAELRKDINELLPANLGAAPATTTAAPQKEVVTPPTARARLEQLQQLLDAKLITQSEYDQKRQKILDEL